MSDLEALPAQVRGHLPSAIEPLGRATGSKQRVDDDRVGQGPGRERPVGLSPGSVGPRRDRAAVLGEHPAGRLDGVALAAHVLDERHDQRLRGSSSPAKNIEAHRRISLSSRSRRFSAFNRFISADSSDVTVAGVDVGLDNPATHGLLPDPELIGHGLTGSTSYRLNATPRARQENTMT